MEKSRPGTIWRTLSTSVDLPEPEGAEMMKTRRHSMFCTCSRAFSISAFIASPSSVIFRASPASPEVLESSVLASRFISCNRKSSFLPTSPPSIEQAQKMLDVVIQADQFLLNVAAVHQQRRFLQNAFRLDLRANQFLHAGLQLVGIGPQHRLAMLFHFFAGLLHVRHALPQFPLGAAPFLLAHLVEAGQGLFHLGEHRGFQSAIGRQGCRFQRARNAQNGIEVRLRRQPEFRGGRPKRLNVAAHQSRG